MPIDVARELARIDRLPPDEKTDALIANSKRGEMHLDASGRFVWPDSTTRVNDNPLLHHGPGRWTPPAKAQVAAPKQQQQQRLDAVKAAPPQQQQHLDGTDDNSPEAIRARRLAKQCNAWKGKPAATVQFESRLDAADDNSPEAIRARRLAKQCNAWRGK